MSEPMTEQQLTEIRARQSHAQETAERADWILPQYQAVRAALTDGRVLLAEVERLMALLDSRARFAEAADRRRQAVAEVGARKIKEAEGRKQYGRQLEARVEELLAERHTTNEALDDAVEAIRAKDQRIAELEKAAVEARAALGSLCSDLEDPGTAALGALYLITQATTWTETGADFAAIALARHDGWLIRQAAEALELASDVEEAINLLHALADSTEKRADPKPRRTNGMDPRCILGIAPDWQPTEAAAEAGGR